jgi:glycerophosphoryl diester phosphodiesterase
MTNRKFTAFAHRGGGNDAIKQGYAENTVAAFTYAIEQGYTYLETDVRAGKDGTLYAWHGSGLERLLPWLPVNAASFNKPGGPQVSTLEDILQALPLGVCLSIDIKHQRAIEPLARVIIKTNAYDKVMVGSFMDSRATEVAQLVFAKSGRTIPATIGGIQTFFGLWWRSKRHPDAPWKTDKQAFWAPHKLVNPALLRAAHAAGLPLYAWTVNRPQDMKRLLDMGVDGMVTDELATLKAILQERQLW